MEKSATESRRRLRRVVLPLVVGISVFIIQLSGQYSAGTGYGMLLISVVLLGGGGIAVALLAFTRKFSGEALSWAIRWLFWAGAWIYVIGVFDLSGYYIALGLAGKVELKWMLFGPVALTTLVLFDIGMYRMIYHKTRPSWNRYRQHISREHAQPELMRKTFLTDVVLHSSLFSISSFRWLRHTLIFWGFVLLFAVEITAMFVREGIPAFGLTDIWEITGHPVRLAFDFAFDFFGLMVLVGCVLSFIWRIKVSQSEDSKFADTPTAVFLFLVIFSGFVLEGIRIAVDGMPTGSAFSFVGFILASAMSDSAKLFAGAYTPLWYFHVFGSLAFIVYVPAFRLVHSCATPVGRMINSQKKMFAIKRMNSIGGLMMRTNKNIISKVETD